MKGEIDFERVRDLPKALKLFNGRKEIRYWVSQLTSVSSLTPFFYDFLIGQCVDILERRERIQEGIFVLFCFLKETNIYQASTHCKPLVMLT